MTRLMKLENNIDQIIGFVKNLVCLYIFFAYEFT